MDEKRPLEEIGVNGEWIWGDDAERTVFAQAFGEQKTLIFRFTLDENHDPGALPNRVVTCYHDIEVEDVNATFPDRSSLRKQIWAAVAKTWIGCHKNAEVKEPDVILDIYGHDSAAAGSSSEVSWRICHDELFNDYLSLLRPVSQLAVNQSIETIDFKSLVRLEQLGGRGCTTRAYALTDPDHRLVFKGIDFRTFLRSYEDGRASEEVLIFLSGN